VEAKDRAEAEGQAVVDARQQMTPIIEKELAKLRTKRVEHFVVGRALMGPRGSGLYKLDLLALAVLDRSLSLLRGFCDLVETTNMIAAAPLLRCQLDNGMRFFASTLVADPHDFAGKVAKGVAVRTIKDRSGKRMMDNYLVAQLSLKVPWLKSLYDQACGYVHLSEQHIFNTVGIPNEDGMTTIGITGQDGSVWTERQYVEAIGAFSASTKLVLELLEGWAQARRQQTECDDDSGPPGTVAGAP
jgi:hypothetical protein